MPDRTGGGEVRENLKVFIKQIDTFNGIILFTVNNQLLFI